MSRDRRLDTIEAHLGPEAPRMRFQMCQAPNELSADGHAAWHRGRGEWCFTLDLGAANVREDL